jgi:hypothetical protein
MQTSSFKPRIPEMALYVPAPATLIGQHIRQGSAIVGAGSKDGHIHCYYEGGVYGQTVFSERLSIACGRLSEKAPTTAFAFVKAEELIQVGTVVWDAVLAAWVISAMDKPDLFTEWTGTAPEMGGTRDQRERAAGLIVSRGPNAKAMAAWQTAINAKLDPVEALITWAREQK